jgi:hypothetical protein
MGADNALKYARDVITKAGGKIMVEKLSRVDLCLDLPDVPMNEFCSAYQDERYICRARGRGCHENQGVTLYWGKRPSLLRIYDKKAEIMVHADVEKIALMEKRRWFGIPECATRVEFELGRESLKRHGIDSPDDYFTKRADLLSYLCTEWFRLTANMVDRTNTSRAEIHPLWNNITAGFLAWAGAPAGESLDPLDRRGIDVRQLLKQGVGVLITAAVLQGRGFLSQETFEDYLALEIRRVLRELNLEAEWARRLVKLSAAMREGSADHTCGTKNSDYCTESVRLWMRQSCGS